MSGSKTEKIYTRLSAAVERAFNIRCAELGINRPAGVEEAIRSWLKIQAEEPQDIHFTCRFCRAEYEISPVNPDRAEVVQRPISEEGGHMEVNADARWMLEEFVRVLNDPNEKNALAFFSDWLSARRASRD